MCNMYVCTACRPVCEFIYLQLHTLQGVLTVYRIYALCVCNVALSSGRGIRSTSFIHLSISFRKKCFLGRNLWTSPRSWRNANEFLRVRAC